MIEVIEIFLLFFILVSSLVIFFIIMIKDAKQMQLEREKRMRAYDYFSEFVINYIEDKKKNQ